MRHQRRRGKLGIKTKHRKALLRNLVRSLVIHKRIRTTAAKAKEASAVADQMVQLAKRGDLHARRLLISKTGCPATTKTLIQVIAPQFSDRKGGYTRVQKLGPRAGDGAEMALLEFTAVMPMPEKTSKSKAKKAKPAKPAQAAEKPVKETKVKAEKKHEDATPEADTKKESEKKGGFLSKLRKYLKGDE